MRSAVLKGLDKLEKRLTDPTWVSKPTGFFLREWREDFRADVLANIPRQSGKSAGLIQSTQDTAKFPLFASVFSDSPKIRYMEYGTGALSDDPLSNKLPYFPSPLGLAEWAEATGGEAWALAKGIEAAGGTMPRHFFRDAERRADQKLNDKMAGFSRNIERAAGGGS